MELAQLVRDSRTDDQAAQERTCILPFYYEEMPVEELTRDVGQSARHGVHRAPEHPDGRL